MQFLENNSHTFEIIKGSRFWAYAYSCDSEKHVKKIRDQLREEHPRASHFCYAWIFEDGRKGRSDDGEPKGSAGQPILKRLESIKCVNILLIVVRYFGGTKLGIGGLVRAYGGIAQQLLEQSTFKPRKDYILLQILCGYGDISVVQSILAQHDHEERHSEFTASVMYLMAVLRTDVEDICIQLREQSSGRITSTMQKS